MLPMAGRPQDATADRKGSQRKIGSMPVCPERSGVKEILVRRTLGFEVEFALSLSKGRVERHLEGTLPDGHQ